MIFITNDQFGYGVGIQQYSEAIPGSKVWSRCRGLPRLDKNNVQYIYARNQVLFVLKIVDKLRKEKDTVIHFKFFLASFIIPLLFWRRKTILDVRSYPVRNSILMRNLELVMAFLCSFLSTKTQVINEIVAKTMRLRRVYVVPLGAYKITSPAKRFEFGHSFIYIGSIQGRNIPEMVASINEYYLSMNEKDQFELTLVGFRTEEEISFFRSKVSVDFQINCVLFTPFTELKPYLERANIGLVFLPIEKRELQYQPSTKLFEYLRNNILVLASKSQAHEPYYNIEHTSWYDAEKSLTQAIVELSSRSFSLIDYRDFEWSTISDRIRALELE